MKLKRLCIIFVSICLLLATGCNRGRFGDRTNVLSPDGETVISIMDFTNPVSIDPIEPGWFHYTFFWHKPMKIDFVEKDGLPAARFTTKDTASMLIRHVDIPLEEYPLLSWKWFIEEPIVTSIDENTRQGDDHAARFFISFVTQSGEKRSMEIIWGNKLKAGEYKYIDAFPHYVARGGKENIGKWFDEGINLLEIYNTIWPDKKSVHLITIGIFCDSDNTDSQSVSYFADVKMKRIQ